MKTQTCEQNEMVVEVVEKVMRLVAFPPVPDAPAEEMKLRTGPKGSTWVGLQGVDYITANDLPIDLAVLKTEAVHARFAGKIAEPGKVLALGDKVLPGDLLLWGSDLVRVKHQSSAVQVSIMRLSDGYVERISVAGKVLLARAATDEMASHFNADDLATLAVHLKLGAARFPYEATGRLETGDRVYPGDQLSFRGADCEVVRQLTNKAALVVVGGKNRRVNLFECALVSRSGRGIRLAG